MAWGIEGLDPSTLTTVLGYRGDLRVEVAPMIYNDRLMVTHRTGYPLSAVAGFCYDKGPAAALAGLHWLEHWDEMEVPEGFKKEAFNDLAHYRNKEDA